MIYFASTFIGVLISLSVITLSSLYTIYSIEKEQVLNGENFFDTSEYLFAILKPVLTLVLYGLFGYITVGLGWWNDTNIWTMLGLTAIGYVLSYIIGVGVVVGIRMLTLNHKYKKIKKLVEDREKDEG